MLRKKLNGLYFYVRSTLVRIPLRRGVDALIKEKKGMRVSFAAAASILSLGFQSFLLGSIVNLNTGVAGWTGSGPSNGNVTAPAVNLTAIPAVWVVAPGGSSWISTNVNDGTANSPSGTYTYTLTFPTAGLGGSLTFLSSADNLESIVIKLDGATISTFIHPDNVIGCDFLPAGSTFCGAPAAGPSGLTATWGPGGAGVITIVATVINTLSSPTGFLLTGTATVIDVPPGAFQVRYAPNLNVGDAFVDFTNTGASNGANLCLNLYTFDPAEELISCCSCTVTPNGLQSLSVLKSLLSNPLTPAIPSSVVVKVIASTGACNASAVLPGNLAAGLLAWGTGLHAQPTTPVSYGVTETAFSNAALSAAELAHITSTCGFIQSNGSGFGICKGCAAGGLGAAVSN
jgi:hypothetical protein